MSTKGDCVKRDVCIYAKEDICGDCGRYISDKIFTSANKPSMPVCPHARLKWAVYDCTIKDSFCLDLMDCNGDGTYSIPGNSGFGYSHQCNKVPGKPAHVG